MTRHPPNIFSYEGDGSVRPRAARQSTHGNTEDFPTSGNVGLLQSLKFVGISRSKAYQYGLVPLYDEDGNRIDEGKVAPFPWLPMPDSIIRAPGQKKIFLAEEIRAWRDAVTHRSRQGDQTNPNIKFVLNEHELLRVDH
ncbi:MAG: hypothetical protein J0I96_17920 [Rhodanobacter sp.]|nr:hypothetical protein [Rhodanobacter sp.]